MKPELAAEIRLVPITFAVVRFGESKTCFKIVVSGNIEECLNPI